MINKQKILVIGLFSKVDKSKDYLTAPHQLADLFEKNNIEILRTAYSPDKFLRLVHTVYTIVTHQNKFSIAIVPLYGTRPAFMLQEITSVLLKFFKKKIILVVHGGSIPQKMQLNALPFLRSLKRANEIVCPSRFLQHAISIYDLRSTIIENSLPVHQYPFIKKKAFRPKIIWMRTFEEVYNPLMAIDVAVILAQKYPDFEMVMAGADKGLLSLTMQRAEEAGIKYKIHFPGYIDLQQKIKYAEEYDFYICTNHFDNAPVSLIEFMALGLPVVAVKAAGIPYMIKDDWNGFLVMPGNAAAMADKIIELIEKSQHTLHVAQQARHYAEQYNESIVIKKWKQLLKQVFNFN